MAKGTYRFKAIPTKTPKKLFAGIGKAHSTTRMNTQGMLKSQNNLAKEQSWRPHISWFQNLTHSYCHQTVWYWHDMKINKQTQNKTKQNTQTNKKNNRKPRYKPSNIGSNDFQQGFQDHPMKNSFETNTERKKKNKSTFKE